MSDITEENNGLHPTTGQFTEPDCTASTTPVPERRVFFIRHGQSTGNAGVPSPDLALIALTDLGWQQARAVAANWTERPTLLVTSPYLRTQQTAAPTIERFPDVPVAVWPVEEFTYLQPTRWNGTRAAERTPHLVRYWNQADPAYCDGEGAESFGTLLRRAEATLHRLAALPAASLVYVFSHGQFIQAVRAVVAEAALDDRGKMLNFWRPGAPPAISNAEQVAFRLVAGHWQLDC
jgi:broad specificity phosphatase PhoE